MRRLALTLLIGAAVAGCTSPETLRTRGGGPGADTGNRPDVVRMHGGSRPYWKTPVRIPAEHPPLEPAQQAQRLSRQ
jgi:hypothetical protein